MFFPECNAIQTVGMPFLIDVVFIDLLRRRIQKTVQWAEPGCQFQTLVPKKICAVLELPAGVLGQTGSMPGDVLVIMSASHSSREELSAIAAL